MTFLRGAAHTSIGLTIMCNTQYKVINHIVIIKKKWTLQIAVSDNNESDNISYHKLTYNTM